MVSQGVIRKLEEHTDWCSSLAFSTKKDGSIRVCIDPQRLNAALRRCPHKIPLLEEINSELSKVQQARRECRLLVNSHQRGLAVVNYVPHTLRQILLE